ncbi:VWA domain-containing protein [Streptomyces prunicolor]|uniref:VWA domain-containing protein n=1 Tax=Streptomyces prunicolor TaxID=67348 RepID=UPI000A30DD69|nr:VWA domain-containing protein [Streptomyces prunicolor]
MTVATARSGPPRPGPDGPGRLPRAPQEAAEAVLAAVEELIGELRQIGVPVSTSESIDAVRSLEYTDPLQPDQLRAALAAALVKSHRHGRAFDTVFDLFFSPGPRPSQDGGPAPDADGTPVRGRLAARLAGAGDTELRDLLVRVLDQRDDLGLRAVTAELVDRHARIRPGQPVAGTLAVQRTFRAVEPDDLRERLAGLSGGADGSPVSGLRVRLAAEEADRRVERLRQEIETEVRRRLVEDRGAAAVARSLRSALPEDLDFLTASTAELAALRAALAPLPAQLAGRLSATRRRARRGPLDFRRTVRASLSAGGVPVRLAFRPPRPAKPELVLLADISGSVATFAGFTLHLAQALRTQFRVVRSFVFVDGTDEVTDLLAGSDGAVEAARRIDESGSGVRLDGRSDYGNALRGFWDRWGTQVGSRSIVVVLGDARTNYRSPSVESLSELRQRAGRVYWLNPEPRAAWGSGDSVMDQYAPHCDDVVECRNIRQLRQFIERLA